MKLSTEGDSDRMTSISDYMMRFIAFLSIFGLVCILITIWYSCDCANRGLRQQVNNIINNNNKAKEKSKIKIQN